MHYNADTFKYEEVPDQELQRLARAKGLYVATDKFENWYLQLLDRPGDGTIDPHLVIVTKVREEIVRYVLEHEGEHKTLGPRDVYGGLGMLPDDD